MNRLSEPTAKNDADRRIRAALADAERLGDPGSSSTFDLAGKRGMEDLPVGVLPEDFLPGYRLQREIHRGGQGIVYHAVQLSTNQSVAIKVMRAGPLAGSSEAIRFQREVQILAEMNHPQIVAIRDTGEARGVRYIVMDFVDGLPIDAYVERDRLDIQQTLRLFASVCDAVNAAQLRGVIHRDLKPSNILVSDPPADGADGPPRIKSAIGNLQSAIPMVLDFGLAKLVDDDSNAATITHEGQFLGSLPWASPEQAAGDQANIDLRTDVYSLGVILYRLLTGRFPYDTQGGMKAVLDRIQHTEPIRPRKAGGGRPARRAGAVFRDAENVSRISDRDGCVVADRDGRGIHDTSPRALLGRIDDDVETIILKCLAKERDRRYQTAGELARDIRRYLAGEAIEAKRNSTWYVLRKTLGRHRAAVVVAAGFLILLVVATAVSGMFWRTAEQRRREMEQVAQFQGQMLSGIDVPLLAVRLRAGVLERARAVAHHSRLDEAATESRIAEIERHFAGADFTGLALELLDENVFTRALEAIDRQFAEHPLVKARLLQTVADTSAKLGLLDRATDPGEEALVIRRRALGDEHPDTLESVNSMGVLLEAQGKLDEAKPYYWKALEGRRRVLGEEHPDTLGSINNMGYLLQVQGKLDEAEPYYREALERYRRLLGDEHPRTLISINNMGGLLETQGKLGEAESYFREALDGHRRVLGDEHRDTLLSMNNVGYLLQARGQLTEAEPYYREALEVRRRVLGHEHPDTLDSVQNMGHLLKAQGKLTEAEPYYREALQVRKRVLGNEHPVTLNSVNNMGTLLETQGKLPEAEPYFRDALEARRRILGNEHPDTLRSINNMGYLLQTQGKFSEADPYYRESLDGNRRVLGNEHPSTLTSISNMGSLLQAQDKLADAEPYFRETLEVRRRVLGNEHPSTLISINNMGVLLALQVRPVEAEPYYREALQVRRRVLGNEHPDTLNSINNMGGVLCHLGRLDEAEELGAEAVRQARGVLPAGHWQTGTFLRTHAQTLAAMKRFAEAEPEMLEAHDIIAAALGPNHERSITAAEALARLYDAWHGVDPHKGYDAKAADWRARLLKLERRVPQTGAAP